MRLLGRALDGTVQLVCSRLSLCHNLLEAFSFDQCESLNDICDGWTVRGIANENPLKEANEVLILSELFSMFLLDEFLVWGTHSLSESHPIVVIE